MRWLKWSEGSCRSECGRFDVVHGVGRWLALDWEFGLVGYFSSKAAAKLACENALIGSQSMQQESRQATVAA